jgi:stage II sporulation protein D
MRFYLLLFAVIAAISGCASVRNVPLKNNNLTIDPAQIIRVLIREEGGVSEIRAENHLDVYDLKLNKIAEVRRGNVMRFSRLKKGVELSISKKKFTGESFYFKGEDKTFIKGKGYRGVLGIKNSGDKLITVNYLDVENYLKGVLPGEMPAGKGDEYYDGLKAFTIVARTYALNKIDDSRKRGGIEFDLYSDVRDQVYAGANNERDIFNRVIEETEGMVLRYKRERCIVFYHSTCGGELEDVSNVFSNNSIDYMEGGTDGEKSYCEISPRFKWEEEFSSGEIVEKLFKGGLIESKSLKLEGVEVVSRFKSGRVNELKFTLKGKRGSEEISIYGNNIRYVIRLNGGGILRSNFIDIKLENGKVKISGRGAGHGVGMCQWGALAMGMGGNNYQEIIKHYFPGTTIAREND